MARALIVKFNTILGEITAEELRQEILGQYRDGGVIVVDRSYITEVIEFDTVEVKGSSPTKNGKFEPFGELDGHSFYVARDEYGRIVVSDELMRELIERASGSSHKEGEHGQSN